MTVITWESNQEQIPLASYVALLLNGRDDLICEVAGRCRGAVQMSWGLTWPFGWCLDDNHGDFRNVSNGRTPTGCWFPASNVLWRLGVSRYDAFTHIKIIISCGGWGYKDRCGDSGRFPVETLDIIQEVVCLIYVCKVPHIWIYYTSIQVVRRTHELCSTRMQKICKPMYIYI